MVARLILALLLALGALPATAMPATCHAETAMAGMAMDAPAHGGARERHPHHAPAVEHGCIGCAALADPGDRRIAAPAPAAAVPPVAMPARLVLGAAGPPTLRPPRIG